MLINLLHDLPTEAFLRWSSLQALGQQMSAHHMTFGPVGCVLCYPLFSRTGVSRS